MLGGALSSPAFARPGSSSLPERPSRPSMNVPRARWSSARRTFPTGSPTSEALTTPPTSRLHAARALGRRLMGRQEAGLVLVTAAVAAALTLFAGTHLDRRTGEVVNDF